MTGPPLGRHYHLTPGRSADRVLSIKIRSLVHVRPGPCLPDSKLGAYCVAHHRAEAMSDSETIALGFEDLIWKHRTGAMIRQMQGIAAASTCGYVARGNAPKVCQLEAQIQTQLRTSNPKLTSIRRCFYHHDLNIRTCNAVFLELETLMLTTQRYGVQPASFVSDERQCAFVTSISTLLLRNSSWHLLLGKVLSHNI